MGCCLSTSNDSAPKKNQHSSVGAQKPGTDTSHVRRSNCKAPPPPPSMEEETVKEVLSETPTPKPKVEEEKKTHKPVFQKIVEEEVEEEKMEKKAPVAEEISEVSEIYSVSESVSTTITERREDDEVSREDEEVRQRVDRSPAKFPRNRSFSGDLAGKRERVVGRSPARRPEPSPGRRNDGVVRSFHGRGGGSQTTARRRLVTDSQRRDCGESSGRRSRSPATRVDSGATRSGLGRSPSARRTGRSPGRAAAVPPETIRKVGETSREGKWPTANESLENPLVSLECFIFL
ncbi:hypothetical protein L1049_010203 [Liquidambar formosana]|uniref:Serine/arginine repetitive matrix protein 1-like n=1 Tax=Liquidambar formosana TaxID=63359 RepID=A0AAP0NB02_LIQFO